MLDLSNKGLDFIFKFSRQRTDRRGMVEGAVVPKPAKPRLGKIPAGLWVPVWASRGGTDGRVASGRSVREPTGATKLTMAKLVVSAGEQRILRDRVITGKGDIRRVHVQD